MKALNLLPKQEKKANQVVAVAAVAKTKTKETAVQVPQTKRRNQEE